MFKWYFLALLGAVSFWLAGCGAIDNPALGGQVAAEGGFTDPNGEAKFAVADDQESVGLGNYDEYDAEPELTDSANNDSGGSSESDPVWPSLVIVPIIGTYPMCGWPVQYTPSNDTLVVSIAVTGGRDPGNTGGYRIRWHLPDGSEFSGTISDTPWWPVPLDTIGNLTVGVSDDGKEWREVTIIEIIPYTYVYYPSEGKGDGKG